MSKGNGSDPSNCRAFVVIVFVMVVCAFLLVIGMSEHSAIGIRRHFSIAAPANNR